VLRDAVWSATVVTGARDLAKGYQLGFVLAAVRLLGVLRGALRAAVSLR